MDRVPGRATGSRSGRAVNNVHVYVVDEHLAPVPLGAPGADRLLRRLRRPRVHQRPRAHPAAFLADPHRRARGSTGAATTAAGSPDGKLEFLGRRDTQVKIRGFRIEIGEIENTLLRVPGVRDGAVVVAERADRSKHLVAFYSGRQPLEVDVLRERLGESLPDYMVPVGLPLAGKPAADRQQQDRQEDADGARRRTRTPSQDEYRRAAHADRTAAGGRWAKVLGIPQEQIGRRDHFFDRGGTSLSAVKLAITLERRCPSRTSPATRSSPIWPGWSTAGPSGSAPGCCSPLVGAGRCTQAGALVCFPYAGGNAVNFQPMAGALRAAGRRSYAVELPGHDVAAGERAVRVR